MSFLSYKSKKRFVDIFEKTFLLLYCLCIFLQVDRNYSKQIKSLLRTDADNLFHLWIIEWLYSFANYIETKEEEEYSLFKMKKYIDRARQSVQVSCSVLEFTMNYLREFKADLPSLCLRQYLQVHWGWVNENCFTESENAALKGDVRGPKANNKLNSSVDATLQHISHRYTKIMTKAYKEYTKTSVAGEKICSVEAELSQHVNTYHSSSMTKQWNKRENYAVMEGEM